MNPKLKALYKELPWLTILKKEIGVADVVKVQRLDAESAQRWTGKSEALDDSYYIDGYFFDKDGAYISKICPQKPAGISGFFNRFFDHMYFIFAVCGQKDIITIEDALEQCERKDEVRYVVLFGHDFNHYSQKQLYVYKMPQRCTTSEFLRELAEQQDHGVAVEFDQASDEVKTGLSK